MTWQSVKKFLLDCVIKSGSPRLLSGGSLLTWTKADTNKILPLFAYYVHSARTRSNEATEIIGTGPGRTPSHFTILGPFQPTHYTDAASQLKNDDTKS